MTNFWNLFRTLNKQLMHPLILDCPLKCAKKLSYSIKKGYIINQLWNLISYIVTQFHGKQYVAI